MDLLARARALAGCPLFENLAPAVLVRLAERARSAVLEAGERRTTDDTVWVDAASGTAYGMIRIVRPQTPAIEIAGPATLVGLAADDVRDVLEEDPAALAALADRLAAQLVS
jgi:hypothetical protein